MLRQEFRSAATNRASREVKAAFAVGMKPSEKVLLRAAAAIAEDERPLRAQALHAMAEERLHEGLNSEALLQQMLDAGEDVDDPMQLPMSDADRQLLAAAVMKEDEPLTPELVEGALQDLRHRIQIYHREREIKRGIVEAERRNDVVALVRLKQEKLELDRKLAAAMQ